MTWRGSGLCASANRAGPCKAGALPCSPWPALPLRCGRPARVFRPGGAFRYADSVSEKLSRCCWPTVPWVVAWV